MNVPEPRRIEHGMRTSVLLLGFVVFAGCDGTVAAPLDAATSNDAAASGDAATASDAAPDDAGVGPGGDSGVLPNDAGPSTPENCATDVDEDRNGYAGCEDPLCWSEAACLEGELGELGMGSGWLACGDEIEVDAAAARARCELGPPPSFETERELRCDTITTSFRLQTYCGPGRAYALRYETTMDLASVSEMLGPRSLRSTSYTPEYVFGGLFLQYGGGSESGETRDPIRGAHNRSVSWVVGLPRPTTVTVFPAVSSVVRMVTFDEDGMVVGSTTGDLELFLAAAFEHAVP